MLIAEWLWRQRKKTEYWLNKNKCASLKYSIIVLEDKTNHRKLLLLFYFSSAEKIGYFFTFTSVTFLGVTFTSTKSNFLASYLYFYLSTQTGYLLQHCQQASTTGVVYFCYSSEADVCLLSYVDRHSWTLWVDPLSLSAEAATNTNPTINAWYMCWRSSLGRQHSDPCRSRAL